MAALMHPRQNLDEYDFDEYQLDEYQELEELREIEIGRAPTRPRLALVGEPRAVVRCSPRTTRATHLRRRVAAVVVVLGIMVAVGKVGATFGGSPLVTPERAPASQPVSIVVQSGDSLWNIAERIAPGADPRPIVDALARDRRNAPLRPGEVLEYRG